jgi:signal transduction histidine kinase
VAFGEIADEARNALAELRVVLGVLRTPGGAADTAPQPGLADLEHLLSRVASAGTDVALVTRGEPRPLPPSVELCGYRIVQEALTNAGRHAPGSRVRVDLAYQRASLSVRVSNGPPRPFAVPALAEQAAEDHGRTGASQAAAACYGLTGLRERVEMLHGQFRAGADKQGGFLVAAVLPAPLEAGSVAPEGPAAFDGAEGAGP